MDDDNISSRKNVQSYEQQHAFCVNGRQKCVCVCDVAAAAKRSIGMTWLCVSETIINDKSNLESLVTCFNLLTFAFWLRL